MKISIVIPTYKKVDQLLRNFNTNLKYMKGCEIVVVNDDPDTSVEDLKKFYPNVVIVQNKKNLGFAGAVNVGIRKATGEYIFLLNNDVILHNQTYSNAVHLFKKDPDLFAVGCAQTEKRKKIVGKNSIRWESGFLQHSRAKAMTYGFTAWAEGGAAVFDKKKLLELGLFDTLYSPFYWEDTDLGYRAWKHGYTVLFDPSIIVEHHHESTISSFFSENRIKTIAYRNQFFFIWTNITDKELWNNHLLSLPGWLLRMLFKGEYTFLIGFIHALVTLGNVKISRKRKQSLAKKTDAEIFAQFK